MAESVAEFGSFCYCQTEDRDLHMLQCENCRNWFHPGCLKQGRPSALEGDVFFHFTCADCSVNLQEECCRIKLQWLQVVMLALYNLQLKETGNCGFFRWREHICSFIAKHWTTFFGHDRKKTHTWCGTVAGTLSAGCPLYFRSGTSVIKENGWWALTDNKPPSLDTISAGKNARRQRIERTPPNKVVEGLRTRGVKSSIQAAIELKAKRDTMQETKELRTDKPMLGPNAMCLEDSIDSDVVLAMPMSSTPTMSTSQHIVTPEHEASNLSTLSSHTAHTDNSQSSSGVSLVDDLTERSSQWSESTSPAAKIAKKKLLTEQEMTVGATLPEFLLKGDEDDEDFEIDPCGLSPQPSMTEDTMPDMEDLLAHIQSPSSYTDQEEETHEKNSLYQDDVKLRKSDIKQEEGHNMSCDMQYSMDEQSEASTSDSEAAEELTSQDNEEDEETPLPVTVKRKRAHNDEDEKTKESESTIYHPMSTYEELQLLKRLCTTKNMGIDMGHTAQRLHRKLAVRKLKRERGLPLFDLANTMYKLTGISKPVIIKHESHPLNSYNLPATQYNNKSSRILDRFQLPAETTRRTLHPVSFINRLVGTSDDQLTCVRSPYTTRMLKPFICRDYETRPLKMKLLQEIQAYPHRNDPDWKMGEPPPIDYCYVRPQHIPSVNMLCGQFFWPGIDLSECLQYPDFSCVVLYRKVVIAFAFMVPDVKYNEAYISFIFTHPEWRRCGIAKFMLYHLIQTCMGKDVTLHVSASNSAMLLYQKFGFKAEEFIVDFYDKYFPLESEECRHAFFIRLRR